MSLLPSISLGVLICSAVSANAGIKPKSAGLYRVEALNRKRQVVSRFETDLSLSVKTRKRGSMKIKRILSAGVLTALLVFSAFAEVKGKSIAFSKDVSVNGMTIREGKYRVEFDSE